jgi:hypothetical protein
VEEMTNPDVPEVVESEAVTDQVETEEGQVEAAETETDAETETEQVEDDSEEVEFEGKQYKLPKELKEALLRQADYTRKTQEVAEARKAFEAQQQEFVQHVQLQQQTLQDHAQLMTIDQQLEQFGALDWNAVIENDPVQALKLQQQFNTLQQMRGQVATRIQQVQQEQLARQHEDRAKRIQSSQEVLAREIKGWSPGNELDTALGEYAKSYGLMNPASVLMDVPRAGAILHKAYLYDQLMSKQAKKPAPEPVKPVTTVKAKSTAAQKDPDRMSPDEWLRWRNSQLKKRA